jgi:four helix bundle protein
MQHTELRDRTKAFALRIVRMYSSLPKGRVGDVLGTQCLRSGTSIAANFREASRARSDAEFIAKLGIVEMELDETVLWLELLVESDVVPATRMLLLQREADELIKIMVTIIKNRKRRAG